MIWAKNHRVTYGTTTPTVPVRPLASRDACGEATYSNWAAAATTRIRVLSATLGSPRRARETVAVDTPASAATSSMLPLIPESS